MNYKLKMLSEKYKNSEDIETLNKACEYYQNMLYYLKAMLETENNYLFFRLLDICYVLESLETDKDDSNTVKNAISLITDFYLNQKDSTNEKFESFLNNIRINKFNEERLKKDIDCVSKTLQQYYLLLKSVIENNNQTKKLMK